MINDNPLLFAAIAFAFFVVALALFLSAIYLMNQRGDSRNPLEQLIDWLDVNEVEHNEYHFDFINDSLNRVEEIELRIPNIGDDLDLFMAFSMAGELLYYGVIDNTDDDF